MGWKLQEDYIYISVAHKTRYEANSFCLARMLPHLGKIYLSRRVSSTGVVTRLVFRLIFESTRQGDISPQNVWTTFLGDLCFQKIVMKIDICVCVKERQKVTILIAVVAHKTKWNLRLSCPVSRTCLISENSVSSLLIFEMGRKKCTEDISHYHTFAKKPGIFVFRK